MTESQTQAFKSVLLNASRIYYEYLDSHHLGLEELKINSIAFIYDKTNEANYEMLLSVKATFVNADSLVLCFKDTFLEISEANGLELIDYDEKSQTFRIGFASSNLYKDFQKNQSQIKIFTDLKFLIKNLENFFLDSHSFQLPSLAAKKSHTLRESISDEQKEAILNILNHPLTYIWGPPGSGKTQVVLFESLLYYINHNQPVCVLAPTNNALEQILRALIRKFDELGLNREKLLRLGMPTNAFLESYIEVCDPQITQKKQKQSLFGAQNLKSRLNEALVIGMTIDGFIRRFKTLDVKFKHIFLDECAFTPLIKRATLFTQGIPLTLLGDHKQLMPICEMPQKEIHGDKAYANLFNLSSLFLEELFEEPITKDSAILSKTQFSPAIHKHTKISNLIKTHRYGNNLAKILDKHIYHNGLCGNQSQTQLLFVDCGRTPPADKTNLKEAQMVAKIYQQLKNEDIAIITPFVKQKKLLNECGIPYKFLWTIHGSQGQEFDSVIFSPVALHHHLTNSQNLNAAYALNVAISRIKKRLIIVCDYAYWIKFQNQFLSDILRESTPFFALNANNKNIQVVSL